MAKSIIQLDGKAYSLDKTSQGTKLLEELSVNMKAVANGKANELLRYAYCMVGGAAKAENKEFNFTVEQFAKACPPNWKKLVIDLLDTPEKSETKDKK